MFIFYIPKDFEINEADILEFMPDHEHTFNDYVKFNHLQDEGLSYEEVMLMQLPDMFEELKEEGTLWHYGMDGCPTSIYYTIVDILQKHDLELQILEINSEGNNQIVAITNDKIMKYFIAEGLKKIQVKGVCEDVTKD
jgi:hypothetical protein